MAANAPTDTYFIFESPTTGLVHPHLERQKTATTIKQKLAGIITEHLKQKKAKMIGKRKLEVTVMEKTWFMHVIGGAVPVSRLRQDRRYL